VKVVEDIIGLKEFGIYITAMLELDVFFLNEDRHMNNIVVIYNDVENAYRTCGCFDYGVLLLANTIVDFPLEKPVEGCMDAVEAKLFAWTFDEQMDAAESLYGQQLFFRFKCRMYQMRKYGYSFC